MKLRFLNLKTKLPLAGLLALLVGALPFPALAQKAIAQSEELQSAIEKLSETVSQLDETTETSREALKKIFDLTLAEI